MAAPTCVAKRRHHSGRALANGRAEPRRFRVGRLVLGSCYKLARMYVHFAQDTY